MKDQETETILVAYCPWCNHRMKENKFMSEKIKMTQLVCVNKECPVRPEGEPSEGRWVAVRRWRDIWGKKYVRPIKVRREYQCKSQYVYRRS